MRKVRIRSGYEHVDIHMIFDINTDRKFTIKERLVADVRVTFLLSYLTF